MKTIIEKTDLSMGEGGLRNHFLVAMPGLNDPPFSQSVTFICEHSEAGAMGLIINHPLPMTVNDVFEQMDFKNAVDMSDKDLLLGGPIQPERGFVLHSPDKSWTSSLLVAPDIYLTASKDIIEDMANGEGPTSSLIILGYAGWEAGQLEQEISDNAWLTVPADSHILFRTPVDQRWHAAAGRIGIDLNLMSSAAGHA